MRDRTEHVRQARAGKIAVVILRELCEGKPDLFRGGECLRLLAFFRRLTKIENKEGKQHEQNEPSHEPI